jgi:hypothetical protein
LGVPGLSGSLLSGWINQGRRPSCNAVNSFVSGPSLSVNGYAPLVGGVAGPAGAEQWGNEGKDITNGANTSTELGVGVGAGHNVSVTQSWSFDVGRLPVSW